jgi:hypothetical protein
VVVSGLLVVEGTTGLAPAEEEPQLLNSRLAKKRQVNDLFANMPKTWCCSLEVL